ncbi:MAG: methyl-accepting chemotaxis protein [Tepidibacter sp.]|uniref:methyl-accepting chemotaxis protein n=1 Tax=Tepidibacter sp. TaxID=2529387 RepID=UPI0025EB90FA|nr:methyl-accepting chemotaxis protein [Tepidibacter sp.]MCT4509088.1 methyl-accepting chemotaxis protein [Tepidibacter sp.]
MNISIKNRLIICFGLIIIMMIGLSFFSIKSINNINKKSTENMKLWFTGVDSLHYINENIRDYRLHEFRHISLNDKDRMLEVKKEMEDIKEDIRKSFKDYMKTVYLEEDRILIQEFQKNTESYLKISDKIIKLSSDLNKKEANKIILTESLNKYNDIKSKDSELDEHKKEISQNNTNASIYNHFVKIFIILTIIIIIISIFLAWIINKSISNRLNGIMISLKETNDFNLKVNEDLMNKFKKLKNKDELSDIIDELVKVRKSIRNIIKSIKDFSNNVEYNAKNMYNSIKDTSITFQGIADATDDLVKGATDQAINAEEAVLKLDNLSKNIEITAENSVEIEKYIDEINKANEEGNRAILGLKESISDNIITLSEVVSQVDILDNESNTIGEITETIKAIADQTNLLALNAMIEAARAGEAGKGFTVVAKEIQKLADQVNNNVDSIENTINNIKLEIHSTKQKIDDSKEIVLNTEKASNITEEKFKYISKAIKNIIIQIDNLINNIQKINDDKNIVVASIQEISAVTQQSSASTEQISASIQQQAAIIEEISNSSYELEEITKELKDIVNEFKI